MNKIDKKFRDPNRSFFMQFFFVFFVLFLPLLSSLLQQLFSFLPVQQLFSFLVVSFNSQTPSPPYFPLIFFFVPTTFFLPLLLQLLLFFWLFFRYFVWGSCVISITCTTIVFFSGCFFQLPIPLLTTPRPCFSFVPSFFLPILLQLLLFFWLLFRYFV